MYKNYRPLAYFILMLTVLFACTKDVGLLTEVEFVLSGDNTEEGHVGEPLPTALTVVPEEVLEGYTYNFSYSVESGDGHFEDGQGEVLEPGQAYALDGLAKDLVYIGSEVGDHRVRFVAEDPYGFTEELELDYILTEVPATWTATASDTELLVGGLTTITVTLGNEGTGDVAYERSYGMVAGSGELTLEDGTGLEMEAYVDIVPGTYRYNFMAEALGTVILTFDLRDGNGQELTAEVRLEVVEELSPEGNDIVAFSLPGQIGTSTIDPDAHTVSVNVPEGTELATAPGELRVSEGATVSPTADAELDFSNPVTYTVTAGNGDVQEWTVNVAVVAAEPEIRAFTINGVEGNISGTDITVDLPVGTDAKSLAPVITFTGDSISPEPEVEQDFTNPVTYTVTSGDVSKAYTVRVAVAEDIPDPEITLFSINGTEGVISGTDITVNLPSSTDVKSLAPTITFIGETLSPESEVEQDFTDPVSYTVTAEDGTTQDYVVTVTVNAGVNLAPVVDAGSDTTITLPTDSVTLTGSATDSDGSVASYSWTKESGGNTTIASPTSASTLVEGLGAGTYVFRLTATDDEGASASETVTVTVEAANLPPVVDAGSDTTITLPTDSVTLSGSATDSDGSVASYLWTKESGGNATIASPTSASTLVEGLGEGTYVFRLTATDDEGASAFGTVTVTVNNAPANEAPIVQDDTYTVYENSVNNILDVLLNDSDSDGDTMVITNIENPINGTASIGVGQQTIIYNATTGNDRFDYTVSDGNGGTSSGTINISVIPNQNPTVEIDETILVPFGNFPKTLDFRVASSNDDGTIVNYEWNFDDDGSTGNIINNSDGSSVSHTFDEAGTYQIVLTVTDNLGATGTDMVELILEAPPEPDFTFSVNPSQVQPEEGYPSGGEITMYFDINPNSSMPIGSTYTMVMTTAKARLTINGNTYRQNNDIPMFPGGILGSFKDDMKNIGPLTVIFTVTENITGISKQEQVRLTFSN
ncbi:DUF5018 domain-containing protein [Zobellia galactanivorans]|uniref:PKD domain-containing protein n=1 Tax=Zobellia galactanivorans (strain DSM 12802 / CCUG 47099 / CIP 106680 / NCIMB 13871 / Dsij) TaxID=63186 RepID=UPI0026E384FE|nr:DUF5018 domain-containing protein [Zobellia galactanivorans]MDO6809801.1 DUF5018 domain-containing protein [Zobellia galactanivorans]